MGSAVVCQMGQTSCHLFQLFLWVFIRVQPPELLLSSFAKRSQLRCHGFFGYRLLYQGNPCTWGTSLRPRRTCSCFRRYLVPLLNDPNTSDHHRLCIRGVISGPCVLLGRLGSLADCTLAFLRILILCFDR